MVVKKRSLTYNDYVKGIKGLRPEEQLSLIEITSAMLKGSLGKEKPKHTKHSIMELEGLGVDICIGIRRPILL